MIFLIMSLGIFLTFWPFLVLAMGTVRFLLDHDFCRHVSGPSGTCNGRGLYVAALFSWVLTDWTMIFLIMSSWDLLDFFALWDWQREGNCGSV